MFNFRKKEKKFYLDASQIKQLIDSYEGCMATDRITVDGCKVGYMYREEPYEYNEADSGWRFLSGDEDDRYMNNSKKHGVYLVNTICNYDPDIIPFLDAEPGTAYIRDEKGNFVLDEE
ncbi:MULTISPECIES: DUF2185 domain-containing protein [Priestia]|jgi:hypothetical protein|uniref:DUF2185 domain-containing protein n=1 Tax=Priestia TaxID=2800373 RepID=UPI001126DA46|nr:DUF2185 domain-containing protein [Priestia megaterium]MDC7783403.1 DUF2185 domain-containing protein [Priestia megaterium]